MLLLRGKVEGSWSKAVSGSGLVFDVDGDLRSGEAFLAGSGGRSRRLEDFVCGFEYFLESGTGEEGCKSDLVFLELRCRR
jgi:hypothetical protein